MSDAYAAEQPARRRDRTAPLGEIPGTPSRSAESARADETNAVPVIVIGAGAAGLATAACLLRRGIRPIVVDRGESVGQTWAERYDRLHLHTPRIQSHLPGYRLPARAGRWVARDDMVRYLQAYAAHHHIDVRLGVTVRSVRAGAGGYRVSGDGVELSAQHVVLATGLSSVPVMPSWPGVESYRGELIHAADYRTAAGYRGRDVLVVGVGNSGAEIAADLAESGARQVWVAVRTPPHIIPRQLGPLPTTLLGILQSFLPAGWVDPVNKRLARATVGDLAAFGLPTPQEGLSARMRRRGNVPTIDVGLLAQLRLGTVEMVSNLTAFQPGGVQLADGRVLRPDVIIAATGYRESASELVEDDSVGSRLTLDEPWPPGLHQVGLHSSQKGMLLQINLDARRVARAIAHPRT